MVPPSEPPPHALRSRQQIERIDRILTWGMDGEGVGSRVSPAPAGTQGKTAGSRNCKEAGTACNPVSSPPNQLPSFPRKRESTLLNRTWIPAHAGMTTSAEPVETVDEAAVQGATRNETRRRSGPGREERLARRDFCSSCTFDVTFRTFGTGYYRSDPLSLPHAHAACYTSERRVPPGHLRRRCTSQPPGSTRPYDRDRPHRS